MKEERKKFTILDLKAKKEAGERITVLTCYDYAFARILEQCDVDCLLVGDSLGMVFQGQDSTLPVTIDEMIYHTRAVARGASHPLLIADMPFLSYQASLEDAILNAGRLLKEGKAEAVKLEGGEEMVETTRRLVSIGIPVVGHIGLQPQSVHAMGGYRIQGKTPEEAERLLREALMLTDAGACALVLEGVPAEVASKITGSIRIPTIGIGSGAGCDGQVLVINDLLGMDESFKPRFVRRYAELESTIREAVNRYAIDVKSGHFPSTDESFHLQKAKSAKAKSKSK